MKKIILVIAFAFVLAVTAGAQTGSLLKRTTTRTEKLDFASGGTVAILGAPIGSIRVVGTNKSQIEITAEIEVQAANEADLAVLSSATGFVVDERLGRSVIMTIGTHNKLGDKKRWKKFPKHLATLPFRIDYTISVPIYSNLEIDGGRGDLAISNVEGALRVNFVETMARIECNGDLAATFGTGKADLLFGLRGWRSRPVDVQMATGNLNVHLPSNASAEIDATILTNGAIENSFETLKPRNQKVPFTERSIIAKAGVGGASFRFSVGNGNLKIMTLAKQ